MKILAIRLNNLASLAGEQSVDFTSEPLVSAGLMAITGPTGSGKSTLLDALCLALFASTPRTQTSTQSHKIPTGAESLSGNDERTLLRRGCASGYAEVDFQGIDGRAYRARWEVRRARDKASGKLQAAQQSLLDLESQTHLGRNKTECKELIEQKLGLNMTQFTRAVLLAQSEFNAFLKASDDERGQLLEKLTDSKIYSQLSKQAYQNTKAAEAEVHKLEQQLDGLCPLPREERQTLEQARQTLRTTKEQRQQQLNQIHQQQQWWQTHNRLTEQCQQAEQAALDTEQQYQAQAPLRQQLKQFEQLKHLHPTLKQLQHWTEKLSHFNAQRPEQQRTCDEAHQALTQATAAHQSASQALQQAQGQYQAAQVHLQQAEDQEGQLQLLQQQLQHLDTQKNKLQQQLQNHLQEYQARQQQQHTQQQQQAQLEQALQQEAALAPLSQHWSYQRPQLHLLVEQLQEQKRHQTEQGVLDQALEHARQQLQQLHLQHQQLEEEAGIPLHQVAEQLSECHQGYHPTVQHQHHCQTQHTLQQQYTELAQHQQQLQSSLPPLRVQHSQLTEQYQQAAQQLQILQQLVERQRLARSQSAETLRAQLQPNTHCPVCGSLEHPWRATEQFLASLDQQDEENLKQAQQQLQALEAQLKPIQRQLDQATDSEASCTQQLLSLTERIQALDLPTEATTNSEEALKQANEKLQQLNQRIQHLGEVQKRYQALCSQQQQLHTTEQKALSNREQHALRQQQLNQSIQTSWAELAACLSEAELQLWSEHPQQAFVQLEQRIQKHRQHEQQHQHISNHNQQLSSQLQHHQQQHTQIEQQLQAVIQEITHLEPQQAALQAQYRTLLGIHTDSKDWRTHLQKVLEQAQQHQQISLQAMHLQQRAADQAKHALTTLQQHLTQAEQAQSQALAQKQQWQAQHPDYSEALITEVSQFSTEQAQAWQATTHTTELAHTRCQAQWVACQQQLEQHAAQGTPQDSEQLRQQENLLQEQQAQTDQEIIQISSQIAEDNRCQVRAGQLMHQLEAARQAHCRQAQISELIGSADGAAFRKLAQAYNLDLLLQYANVQLQQLAKRYRLQRGGSPLGLWIIDTDMGDECRSVHSLSGGESFLVSLALALGLAAMASQTLAIESLFIDEGFGSLDPDTLQVALDALDSLQAQGRKVVVISHMQALHERIGVQIQITPQGNGQSQICILTP